MAWPLIAAGVAAAGSIGSAMINKDGGPTGSQSTQFQPADWQAGASDLWDKAIDSIFNKPVFDPEYYKNQYDLNEIPTKAELEEMAASELVGGKIDGQDYENMVTEAKRDPEAHFQYFGRFMGHSQHPEGVDTRTEYQQLSDDKYGYIDDQFNNMLGQMQPAVANYGDMLASLGPMLQQSQDASKANPLMLSMGGQKLGNVYGQGGINMTKDMIDLNQQVGEKGLLNSMRLPQMEFAFNSENTPQDPQLNWLDKLLNFSMTNQAQRYATPGSQTETGSIQGQNPGFLDYLNSGLQTFNSVAPFFNSGSSNVGAGANGVSAPAVIPQTQLIAPPAQSGWGF